MKKRPINNTSIRFLPEDRAILQELQTLTGLTNAAAVVRFAIRELLIARRRKAS
jgi:hypothetical protein